MGFPIQNPCKQLHDHFQPIQKQRQQSKLWETIMASPCWSIVGKILTWLTLSHLTNCFWGIPVWVSVWLWTRPQHIDIVLLRQFQEKCIEQHMDLYAVFSNLTKAFDTVNRESLRDILTKPSCAKIYIRSFDSFMMAWWVSFLVVVLQHLFDITNVMK